MPRGFGRLPFLRRRSSASDRSAADGPAEAAAPADPDAAPLGPPVLLPASIIRQVLVDASELTPVWARPRPDPEPIAVPVDAKPKRSRRASTAGPAKAPRTDATPRRTRRSTPKAGGQE